MEINENALKNNNIKAVLSGKVYRKYKEIGDYVKRGDIIAQIGESNNIYAKINVDESNIRKISLGQVAIVRLNTDEKKTYTGKVSEIYPAFEESSQSFLCKITLPSLPSNAIVNTQLQANIIISETKNALVIPRNYLDFGGYVQEKDKKNKTKIKTRFISTEWVQIIEGINESSVLITENIAENNVKTSELGSQLK
jgi:multidrug efflux pump subunit AcrA (membrane-fusion protein)